MERIVYRASSLGGCAKRLIAERLGYQPLEPPAKYRELFAKGDDAEKSVIKQMRFRGDRVWAQQREVSFKVSDRVVVEGHIDGLVNLNRSGMMLDTHILEVKSMSDSEYQKFLKSTLNMGGHMERYKWQISAYMHAMRLPCWLAVVNRDRPGLWESVINTPFYTIDEINIRVFTIEALARNAGLPQTCDQSMFPCPFYYLHEDSPEEIEEDEAIEALAETYLRVRDESERAKASYERVREQLKAIVGDRRTVESRSLRVTRYNAQRTSYDYRRAIEAGIDLEPYKKVSSYDNLRVTVKDAPSGGDEPRTDSADGSVERGEESRVV